VRYKGKFLDGTVFDSNVEKIDPIVVNLGKAEVIIGWEEVLLLVKKGGKYTFYIPSLYCYGDTGSGKRIPPNSILVFEMEITDIQKK
jgi:FKBP-type peptidyl-prolyl cis-trans isomerase FkpA